MNILASGLADNREVHLVRHHYQSESDNVIADVEAELELAELMAGICHAQIIPSKIFSAKSEMPNYSIKDGDLVSSNLFPFFDKICHGKNVSVFAEGASCLSWVIPEKKTFSYPFKLIKRRVKDWILGRYQYKNKIIFDDVDGRVSVSSKKIKDIVVVPFENLYSYRKKLAKVIFEVHPEIESLARGGYALHLPIYGLSEGEYRQFAEDKFSSIDRPVVIKLHPSDMRDFTKIFTKLPCFILNGKYKYIPAEVFMAANEDIQLLSYYTTALLSCKISSLNFVVPDNSKIIQFYAREYWRLKSLLGF